MSLHHVYTLRDPRDDAIRYVGITCKTLPKRLATHLCKARGGGSNHRCCWLRSLLAAGVQPIIELVESVCEPQRQSREQYWIGFYRGQGCDLVNATEGGEGTLGYRMPAEAIERMRAKKKGKKHGPRSAETRRKISEANRGKPLSIEHRAKLSASHKGYQATPEQRAKLSAAGKGRRHSEATKAKMSKPKTEQHRENAAAALRACRLSGRYKPATGDRNGLRMHPEAALRGSKNPSAKLNEAQVVEIRQRYVPFKVTSVQLAVEYGVSQAQIWNALTGKTWKHVAEPCFAPPRVSPPKR